MSSPSADLIRATFEKRASVPLSSEEEKLLRKKTSLARGLLVLPFKIAAAAVGGVVLNYATTKTLTLIGISTHSDTVTCLQNVALFAPIILVGTQTIVSAMRNNDACKDLLYNQCRPVTKISNIFEALTPDEISKRGLLRNTYSSTLLLG